MRFSSICMRFVQNGNLISEINIYIINNLLIGGSFMPKKSTGRHIIKKLSEGEFPNAEINVYPNNIKPIVEGSQEQDPTALRGTLNNAMKIQRLTDGQHDFGVTKEQIEKAKQDEKELLARYGIIPGGKER